MLAVLAPGQGSQTPGFLSPWLELPGYADSLAELSEAAGVDLARYGTVANADEIRDTQIAQPLLVAAGLLAAEALLPDGITAVGVTAGHSVGELAAAGIAGVLTPVEAMRLVGERGRAMAEAAAATPTSMTAVIGGKPDEVIAAIERAGLTPANNNGTGQIVAAGTTDQLAALAADPPPRARLIPLSVAGAFHTTHMQPAVERLAAVAATVTPRDPRVRLLSNADGAEVADGAEALRRIVAQVANPVRWDLCLATLAELGVTGVLELPPAGTLTGIAKRNLKGTELFALNTPDQLDEARTFVAAHAA